MSAIYECKVPTTKNMSSFKTMCHATAMETKEENALWDYNHARGHDGLHPLEALPKGTTFTLIKQ
jgi:hypothetical protein